MNDLSSVVGARGSSSSKSTGGMNIIGSNNNNNRSGGRNGHLIASNSAAAAVVNNVAAVRKHNNGSSTGRSGAGREKKSEKKGVIMDDQETRLNSNVCKRMDPNFIKIIKVASQVGVYEYDCQAGKWTSAGISGCLFFYERSQSPKFGLIILNRNSLDNFLQLLTPDIEIQVDVPHILMNNHDVIRCLWFYSQSECLGIANDLSKRLGFSIKNQKINHQQPSSASTSKQEAPPPPPAQLKQPEPPAQQQSSATTGNQILSLLFQQPQQPQQQQPQNLMGILPEVQESRRTEVDDAMSKNAPYLQLHQLEDKLWKGSSVGSINNKNNNEAAATGDPILKFFQPVPDNNDEDVGDRLVKSDDVGTGDKKGTEGPGAPGAVPSKLDSLGDELRATLGIKNKNDTVVNQWMSETDTALRDLHFDVENGLVLEDLKWEDPEVSQQEPTTMNIDAMRMFVNDCKQYGGSPENGLDESRDQFETRQVEIFEKERREAAIRQTNTRESESGVRKGGGGPGGCSSFHSSSDAGGEVSQNPPAPPAVMLSKDQMLQAFTYLLKTDPEFTDKLHKAYLNSVLESREN